VVSELSNWVLLHHTNVLPLIKIARLNFRIAAWMELCAGTLQDVIEQRALTWSETRAILLQVTEALGYALDEHQVAHLDIKPANIMVKDFPNHVQVSDWGISKITQKGKIVGFGFTPGFLPPERMMGKSVSGVSSDIFALGMTGIMALTQLLPYLYQQDQSKFGTYDEQQFRQLQSHQYFQNATQLLARFPAPIQDLLLGMIHPDPSTRFAEYGRLMHAIAGVPA
jgi:serine/threonine protein kinase